MHASALIFSSGTTSEPKRIEWSHATPLRAAVDAWAHMDLGPGQTLFWPTSFGWMMGAWSIYAALANRATLALFVVR